MGSEPLRKLSFLLVLPGDVPAVHPVLTPGAAAREDMVIALELLEDERGERRDRRVTFRVDIRSWHVVRDDASVTPTFQTMRSMPRFGGHQILPTKTLCRPPATLKCSMIPVAPHGERRATALCGALTGRYLRRASVPSVLCIAKPAQPLGRCSGTAFGCGTALRSLWRRLTDAPVPRRGALAGRGQIQRIQLRPVRLQRDRQDQLSGSHVASSSPARTGSRKVWAALVTSSRVSHANWSSRAIAA